MKILDKNYINGQWVVSVNPTVIDVINPADETISGKLSLGCVEDINTAVAAAKAAFDSFSQTTREERISLLERVCVEYEKRMDDMASAIQTEMGAPNALANGVQAPIGLWHTAEALRVLKDYSFEEEHGTGMVIKEPIGVVAMITPWNWPVNQIACKVAPALATGCTMVLKPSEVAPYSAQVWAEIMDAAGVPAGVFNMVPGAGIEVGNALSGHPDIDMISVTGSTRMGSAVQANAAKTIKRVCQELGGKSANIILDDADFDEVVTRSVTAVMGNSGQTCTALTRLLVPNSRMTEVLAIAKTAAAAVKVGHPQAEDTAIGPIANGAQYGRVVALIDKAIAEGTPMLIGGSEKPEGLANGYYVKPTVFGPVGETETLAVEEVFGPVLSIMGYEDEDDAIRIANSSVYGLNGGVSSKNIDNARRVARRLRTGMVELNGVGIGMDMPFGGYKQSGNGREWGVHAFADFLEVKSIGGYEPEVG